ncbi:MAG: nitroreductase family protein [Bacteroidales bacterium]
MKTIPAITQRYSPMGFNPERLITDEERNTLFNAARWAASSFNEQPWRFIWADRTDPEAWDTMISLLTEYNQRWASTSSLLVMAIASEIFDKTGKRNGHARYDLGMSVANMVIQATSMGLQAHQMGGFDGKRAVTELDIPEGFAPVAVIALGEAVSVDQVAEEFRERASEARVRKSLDTFAFRGGFGRKG